MRRTYLLSLAVALPLLACDLIKGKGDADAAADAAAAPVAAPAAAPTDTGGAATATPTGAATLGGAKPGTGPVAPKVDGGPAADAGVATTDAGVRDGGPIPSPTFVLPTFPDAGFHGFDAGAFIPPGFDAGGFKLPGQK